MAAINKSFVIKNGLEVSTNLIFADAPEGKVGIGTTNPEYLLHVKGGIGATNSFVSGISTTGVLHVGTAGTVITATAAGSVGLGTTNPQYKLHVIGGIGVTDSFVTGISTVLTTLRVGTGGTVLTVLGVGNSIGVGTASPQYLFHINSPVSTGQTALYVQGDVRITGDLSVDDITFDDATLSNLTVTEALNVTSPGISTFGGYVDINNSVDISGTLNVSGISTLGGYVDINNSVDISGTLNVVGLSTLGGYVDINNSVDISNNLNVTGIATIATVDINAGEIDVTRIETGNLSVTGIGTIVNGFITNLTGTAGTITTFNSTNGTITNLTGTAATITTFNSTNSTITNLNVTGIATIATLNATGIAVTNFTVYNSLSVGGISTFTNGPVLIGSGTSTGTASQRLQVTGGTYVSGNLGIGSTNPTSKLHVIGDARITGVVTATTFVGALTGTASSTTNIPNLTGAITSNNTTTTLGSFSSANLSTALTDETGTGVAVFATSPTLVTPVLGAASATSINSSGIITATTFVGNLTNTLTLATSGTGLSGSTTFNNSAASTFTVTSNATNNNTNSTIVARDSSGNFSAGTITA
jgi:hypothetical protein